ncbi:probable amino acid permease 7 isoform X1 [Punica granatum]|uniref:Probable amino acid permease 7 isoform X1 n=1 Tax=Punica granatum TaxID=22663 RepID=A0A6P8BZ65_PUNGR|nr:probable amino acid permease 7 isoform X1 [Punica granatum]
MPFPSSNPIILMSLHTWYKESRRIFCKFFCLDMALHDQSLELADPLLDDDGRLRRTGTLGTCVAHIITGVIGSGVLSLAWSVAQLGWIGGPVALLCFAIITYFSASKLADCYRYPDSVNGKRNYSYMDAVRVNLGYKRMLLCGFLQYLSMFVTGVAYVITVSTCMRALLKANCYHREGHQASCKSSDAFYMLIFGAVQIVMSQIPDFQNMEWLSWVATIMSFCYSTVGLGLGLAKVIGKGKFEGGITGVRMSGPAKKTWTVFEALGDVAFAYPYTLILLEIQDTLKSPPPENKTMKKGSLLAIIVTTFFYFACGCFGYAALGDSTPGNLLTGFGFYEPFWLIDFANVCIIMHLVGGYQIYSQPIFATFELWFARKFPNSGFISTFYTMKSPIIPSFRISLFRLFFRTSYVASTVGIALAFPYFNSILGVLGAINFWPLAIYFPFEMYILQRKITAWSREWVALRTLSLICLIVSLLGFVGSFVSIISAKFNL